MNQYLAETVSEIKRLDRFANVLLGCQMRFTLEEKAMEEKLGTQKKAPSAVIVAT